MAWSNGEIGGLIPGPYRRLSALSSNRLALVEGPTDRLGGEPELPSSAKVESAKAPAGMFLEQECQNIKKFAGDEKKCQNIRKARGFLNQLIASAVTIDWTITAQTL